MGSKLGLTYALYSDTLRHLQRDSIFCHGASDGLLIWNVNGLLAEGYDPMGRSSLRPGDAGLRGDRYD